MELLTVGAGAGPYLLVYFWEPTPHTELIYPASIQREEFSHIATSYALLC